MTLEKEQEVEVDAEALFADLRTRGINYEGDETWHLRAAAADLRRAQEERESEEQWCTEKEIAPRVKKEERARLIEALESGDPSLFDAEFNRQLGLADEPMPEVIVASEGSAEADLRAANHSDWVDEALAAPTRPELRLPKGAWDARIETSKTKALFRDFSRRVFVLQWEKKFPFSVKALKLTTKSKELIEKNEGQELLHPSNPGQVQALPVIAIPKHPAWDKLPASKKRSPDLMELIAGVRFASIAVDGPLTPEDWLLHVPGEEVCCLSIDLHGKAASRFLQGEGCDVGSALARYLRRRLERHLGDLPMAVVWVRPAGGAPGDVRVFLVLRSSDNSNARNLEAADRGMRYFRSLARHDVRISPDNMPLWIPDDEDRASYLGVAVAELEEVTGLAEQEYTPETGFASTTVIAARAAKSHAKWSRFAAAHQLPTWFDAGVIGLLQDYFVHGPEHARARQQLKEKIKKDSYYSGKCNKSDELSLSRMQMMELPPWPIRAYRGSPAQLAAIAIRSGEVLGDYCDSRHKAGRAKELYEKIRRDQQT